MTIEDGDDALLGRYFHVECMAPEPWDDEARDRDVVRLLPVGDRIANGVRCNCFTSLFPPGIISNGRSRAVHSLAREETPDSRSVSM